MSTVVAPVHYAYARMGQSNPNTARAVQTAIGNDAFQQDTYISRTKWTPASKNPNFVFQARLSLRAAGFTLVGIPATEIVTISDSNITNVTKFYLQNSTNSTTGLPTAEQSTRTSTWDMVAQTINNQMTVAIGTTQTQRFSSYPDGQVNIYMGRWVTPPLAIGDIPSGTWTLNFAAWEENSGGAGSGSEFPVLGNNQDLWVNVYVWRPSTTTKIGTILDGATASVFDEPSAVQTEKVMHGTFSGSAVTNILTNDVLVFELWTNHTIDPNTNDDCAIYFGGSTENTTENATVSNHASFIQAPAPGLPLFGGDNITVVYTPAPSGTQNNRSVGPETTTVADSSLVRTLSSVRIPSADSTTVTAGTSTRVLSAVRVPASDSTTVADVSTTALETYVRTPAADSTTVADSSTTRMLSAVRVPTTEVPALSENVSRMLSATRVPASDSVTAVDSSTTKSATRVRAPTTDTVTPSDSSLTRMLSAVRVPASDSVTVTAGTSTRMLSASRIPSADTITTNDNATPIKSQIRIPAADSITVADSSLTRILSAARIPSADTVTALDSSITRIRSLLRIPSQDSIATSENLTSQYTQGAQSINRAPTAENITVADSSLTRLLSALRLPSTDSISIGELLTRILSAIRSPTADSVVTADNTTRSRSLPRTPASDSITVLDSAVTRMLSALRLPSQDTITVTAGTATRMLSAIRIPSVEVISVSESLGSTLSGRVTRSASDTVIVGETLTRMLQAFRTVPQDTINVNEQLIRSRTALRFTGADTSVVSEAALTRALSLTRTVSSDTTAIIESALNRILSAARNLQDTVTVAELQSLIQHSRVLQDTISVTEPTLNRVVTAIRAVAPEFVNVAESVFYQAFHKFVFDSVTVAESLFKERTSLSGSVTYATPDEVRPLLGNIGPTQRTDEQIELAIDAAYDEINTKTNRIPPDDWKDTDHNFGVIKKLARYIAAKEMAVGIKDFDTAALDSEIEHLWEILTYDTTSSATQNIVVTSQPETYASLREGIIWSTRYNNLKKNSSNENDTTINPDT